MNNPRQFTDFSDYPQNGFGKIDVDDNDYIEPSEDWVDVEDEMEDTDV